MTGVRRTPNGATTLPTVLLFGLGTAVEAEVDRLVGEFGCARVSFRDLRGTCAALKTYPVAILVGSTDCKPWDRDVAEDHAARAGVPVRWLASDEWHAVDGTLRPWLVDSRLRARFR